MGQVYVKASRRARAHFRASGATRMFSSRHSTLEAVKNISKAFNAPGAKSTHYRNLLTKRLKSVLTELADKRKRGARRR